MISSGFPCRDDKRSKASNHESSKYECGKSVLIAANTLQIRNQNTQTTSTTDHTGLTWLTHRVPIVAPSWALAPRPCGSDTQTLVHSCVCAPLGASSFPAAPLPLVAKRSSLTHMALDMARVLRLSLASPLAPSAPPSARSHAARSHLFEETECSLSPSL